ncbi:hypothetical protein FACS189491_02690 [Spirochaetia bacterium]|nr:hypothetical protein FACS189491_02690 [Spirochaetia bacterium]
MKKLFALFCAAFLFFLPLSTVSAQLFNNKLTRGEQQKLANGEILIRNIEKSKNISLNPVNQVAKQAIDTITALKPTYLAEVIQILPYNETLINRIQEILLDIPSYQGIPYYSVRNEQYFDLYSSARIISMQKNGGRSVVEAELLMPPFNMMEAHIVVTNENGTLFFQQGNKNPIRADNITVAKANNMQSIIVVFRQDTSLVLYGIGGVNAPVIFFLKDRIETSFMNRIKTFCMYVYEKL